MFEVKVSELTYKAFYYLEISSKEEKAAYKALEELPALEYELEQLNKTINIKNQFVISREAKEEVASLYKQKSKLTEKINKRKQAVNVLRSPQMIYEQFLKSPQETRFYDFDAVEATKRITRGCK